MVGLLHLRGIRNAQSVAAVAAAATAVVSSAPVKDPEQHVGKLRSKVMNALIKLIPN